MTIVGSGGVVINRVKPSSKFIKDWKKLDKSISDRLEKKLKDLLRNPRPPGLCFEKLQGHDDIYTIHVTGNYKVSFNIINEDDVNIAFLRRVSNHNEIDRAP